MEETEQPKQKHPIYDDVDDTLVISEDLSMFAEDAVGTPVNGKPKRD